MKKLLCIAILFLLQISQAFAVSSDWKKEEELSLRLIAGNKITEKALLGLQMQLSPGWHSYWRTPGDGGIAPNFDWSKSKNIKNVEIKWPAPVRFVQFGTIETFAYEKDVLFPILITPENPAEPIEANVDVKYGVCNEICIFHEASFSLNVPVGHIDEESTNLIEKSLSLVPAENGSNGLTIKDAKVSDDGKLLEVNVENSKSGFENPDLFVEVDENFRFPKAEISFSDDRKNAKFLIPFEVLLSSESLSGKSLKLTLVDSGKSVEQVIILPQLSPVLSPTTPAPETSILFILAVAFLGGLILNIMPCVLPVLSIKIFGVMKHGGGSNAKVRASFLMSAAGIITSFLILASLVISLKSAGMAVGWGFHFQQPLFLIFMTILLVFFSANQFDLFEINLPSSISSLVSEKLHSKEHSAIGNFLTGVFATLLATPCSAPFLGTAISFALSQGTKEIIMIFTMVGIGLASPYMLFAIAPKLVTKLPKPGAWMLRVRHFMGVLLLLTSIWLIWVISGQLGFNSALSLLVISALIFIFLILIKNAGFMAKLLIFSALVIAGFYAPQALLEKEKPVISKSDFWVPFEREKINVLVAEGKVVFVDVTADWCITCKFNKINVLDTGEISEALSKDGVVAMLADYTNPDKNISDYLKSYNRYGIPFNIIYGPGAPEGIPLSELLSKQAVIDALEKAKGK